jgi:hypothetical protein
MSLDGLMLPVGAPFLHLPKQLDMWQLMFIRFKCSIALFQFASFFLFFIWNCLRMLYVPMRVLPDKQTAGQPDRKTDK